MSLLVCFWLRSSGQPRLITADCCFELDSSCGSAAPSPRCGLESVMESDVCSSHQLPRPGTLLHLCISGLPDSTWASQKQEQRRDVRREGTGVRQRSLRLTNIFYLLDSQPLWVMGSYKTMAMNLPSCSHLPKKVSRSREHTEPREFAGLPSLVHSVISWCG